MVRGPPALVAALLVMCMAAVWSARRLAEEAMRGTTPVLSIHTRMDHEPDPFAEGHGTTAEPPSLVSTGARDEALVDENSPLIATESAAAATSSPSRLLLMSYYKLGFPRKLPGYSMLWMRSCDAISAFADCSLTLVLDDNDTRSVQDLMPCQQDRFLHLKRMVNTIPLSQLVSRMEALGSKQKFQQHNAHRKTNDLKPMFAFWHQDVLAQYSHWGWTDIDGVLGRRIGEFLGNGHVAQTFLCCTCVAVPYLAGQLTIFRVTPETIQAFRRIPSWIGLLDVPRMAHLEEMFFYRALENMSVPVVHHHDAQINDYSFEYQGPTEAASNARLIKIACNESRGDFFVSNDANIYDKLGHRYVYLHFSRSKHLPAYESSDVVWCVQWAPMYSLTVL